MRPCVMPLHHRRRVREIRVHRSDALREFFDVLGSKLKFFSSIDVHVELYRTIRSHGALARPEDSDQGIPREDAPLQLDVIIDPSFMEQGVSL